MKILELRFRNLNSLAGEWRIDFTDPSYECSGIFVITGPTGSGKTTILDAICLALYGQTPRLGKLTKGTNELMTRHTAECFAEVVFESSKGRFRCHWSQKRAKKRPDGELQPPQHEISDVSSGATIESKIRDVQAKVQEYTGMDFLQFTRSIMLAQGGFAAFLVAAPADRAPILEQITGTGIYSEISRKVHERASAEGNRLDTMKRETDVIRTLSPEELEQLDRENGEMERRSLELQAGLENTDRAINRLNAIAGTRDELDALETEKTEFFARSEEKRADLDRLARARLARRFEPLYQALQESTREIDGLKERFESGMQAYSDCQEQCQALRGKIGDTSDALGRCGNDALLAGQIGEISLLADLFRMRREKISLLGSELLEAERTLAQAREREERLSEECRKKRLELEAAVQVGEAKKAELAAVLKGRDLYAWYDLERDAVAAMAELQSLAVSMERSATLERQVSDLRAGCTDLGKEKDAISRKADQIREQVRAAEVAVDSLEEKCRLIERVHDLEEERKRLEDGKPCPLCGSPDHPYSGGQIPREGASGSELTEWKQKLAEYTALSIELGNEAVGKETMIGENRKRQAGIREELVSLHETVSAALSRRGLIPGSPDLPGKIRDLIASEQGIIDASKEVGAVAGNLTRELATHDTFLQAIRTELGQIRLELAESATAIGVCQTTSGNIRDSLIKEKEDLEEALGTLTARLRPFGLRIGMDEEPRDVLSLLRERAGSYQKLEDERTGLNLEKTALLARMDQLRQQIEEISIRIEEKEEKIREYKGTLRDRVTGAGFAGCPEYLDARIDQEQFDRLEKLESELTNEGTRISALIAGKTDELRGLREGVSPDVTREMLEGTRAGLADESEVLRARLAEIRVKLEQDRDMA
ncbi:MAG: AAA family ATPase, partial [Methanoregulaceae archaeon]|nr:AAA family ATPase [Methanoregulaceae archaeon]